MFADDETRPPVILWPNTAQPLSQLFTFRFVIPEPALPGSVKMAFHRVGGRFAPLARARLACAPSCASVIALSVALAALILAHRTC